MNDFPRKNLLNNYEGKLKKRKFLAAKFMKLNVKYNKIANKQLC